MGYKPTRKLYQLVDFPDFPGMEVTLTGMTVGEMHHMQELQATNQQNRNEILDFMADKLDSWNLEHPAIRNNGACSACGLLEDAPMPLSVIGLACLDFEIILKITLAWMSAMVRLPLAQSGNSSNGEPNIPALTEQLLTQLQSATVPNLPASLLPNSSSV